MSCNSIEEVTVVTDDDSTSCKPEDSLFQCSQSVYIKIVGGLVKKEQVSILLECESKLEAVALSSREVLCPYTKSLPCQNITSAFNLVFSLVHSKDSSFPI